jgi:hypothetical protein
VCINIITINKYIGCDLIFVFRKHEYIIKCVPCNEREGERERERERVISILLFFIALHRRKRVVAAGDIPGFLICDLFSSTTREE